MKLQPLSNRVLSSAREAQSRTASGQEFKIKMEKSLKGKVATGPEK
ncbi:MAG: hypothetical protein R3B52_02760 [Candidatus Paceibacterota bacterium]